MFPRGVEVIFGDGVEGGVGRTEEREEGGFEGGEFGGNLGEGGEDVGTGA